MTEILPYLVLVTVSAYWFIPPAMGTRHVRLTMICLTVTQAVQVVLMYYCRVWEWQPVFLPVSFFCLGQSVVISQVFLVREMKKGYAVFRNVPEGLIGGAVALVLTSFVWGLADCVAAATVVKLSN